MVHNYYLQLENALYDFFLNLGDREEDLVSGGVYRGQAYEPMEVPLATISKAIGFDLSGGMGANRIRQLDDIGLYQLRRTGPGKPSFLSLLVWDHDEHFQAKAASRIATIIERKAKELDLAPGFIEILDSEDTRDAAYAKLVETFTAADRERDIPVYWKAYLTESKKDVPPV